MLYDGCAFTADWLDWESSVFLSVGLIFQGSVLEEKPHESPAVLMAGNRLSEEGAETPKFHATSIQKQWQCHTFPFELPEQGVQPVPKPLG